MMKLLDISEKYGKITHQYPFAPYKVADHFRGKPAYVLTSVSAVRRAEWPALPMPSQSSSTKSKTSSFGSLTAGDVSFVGDVMRSAPQERLG